MVKNACILAFCLVMITFLLFAFASWNINPAMWLEGCRIGCSVAFGVELFIIISYLCIEGIL